MVSAAMWDTRNEVKKGATDATLQALNTCQVCGLRAWVLGAWLGACVCASERACALWLMGGLARWVSGSGWLEILRIGLKPCPALGAAESGYSSIHTSCDRSHQVP
jgi:hypothetical protein